MSESESEIRLSAITSTAVDLHPRVDKDEIREAKVRDADGYHNRSTKGRPNA